MAEILYIYIYTIYIYIYRPVTSGGGELPRPAQPPPTGLGSRPVARVGQRALPPVPIKGLGLIEILKNFLLKL